MTNKKIKSAKQKELYAFKEIVELLIQNSLLLTIEEKEEFIKTVKLLEFDELKELFRILTGSRRNVDQILVTISRDFPQVAKKLSAFQQNLIKEIFSSERELYKSEILNNR